MSIAATGAERRARLAAARLYLVCSPVPDRDHAGGRDLAALLEPAIAGGVEIVQLRGKQLGDDQLTEQARLAQALCRRLGALLIVNDRPLVAREAGADGVHIGQQDMAPEQARELVGADMLIGLSTHATTEIDAARPNKPGHPEGVDYIGVGPVHETPTKPGRAAVGLELVRYAAAHASVPFFAIGGLNAGNIAEVLDAGATRVVVLRAIADAEDPGRAASELCALLDQHQPEGEVARARV